MAFASPVCRYFDFTALLVRVALERQVGSERKTTLYPRDFESVSVYSWPQLVTAHAFWYLLNFKFEARSHTFCKKSKFSRYTSVRITSIPLCPDEVTKLLQAN